MSRLVINPYRFVAAVSIYLRDDFTGSGNLGGRTPDGANTAGGTWTAFLGNMTVENGDAGTTTNASTRLLKDVGVADYVIRSSLKVPAGSTPSTNMPLFQVRHVDTNNRALVCIGATGVRFTENRNSSTTTELGTTSATIPTGIFLPVVITLSGNQLSAVVDGASYGPVTLANAATPTVLALSTSNSLARWDYIEVASA